MPAPKKYTAELRERATRLVVELRTSTGQKQGAIARVADQLGVNLETLRTGSTRPRSTAGQRPGTTLAAGVMARKRATPILTRRVKQAIAEWYVLDMLEKAWGGLMEHTEQGFNIGKPPYGYQVVVEKHPVPAKAALGKVKRRLVRDPVRGPVVTQIYTWRVAKQLLRRDRRPAQP